jgi:hypothetical protein
MRHQWRRFRRLLSGALGVVWLLCTSGILYLPTEEDPTQWYYARMALLAMLAASTLVTLWLWARATREIRHLSQRATEARLEAARREREERRKRPRRTAAK